MFERRWSGGVGCSHRSQCCWMQLIGAADCLHRTQCYIGSRRAARTGCRWERLVIVVVENERISGGSLATLAPCSRLSALQVRPRHQAASSWRGRGCGGGNCMQRRTRGSRRGSRLTLRLPATRIALPAACLHAVAHREAPRWCSLDGDRELPTAGRAIRRDRLSS